MNAPTTAPQPIQVSEREAAKRLNISERTLYNRRQTGKIKFVREGSRILYRLDALDAYSKANEVQARAAR